MSLNCCGKEVYKTHSVRLGLGRQQCTSGTLPALVAEHHTCLHDQLIMLSRAAYPCICWPSLLGMTFERTRLPVYHQLHTYSCCEMLNCRHCIHFALQSSQLLHKQKFALLPYTITSSRSLLSESTLNMNEFVCFAFTSYEACKLLISAAGQQSRIANQDPVEASHQVDRHHDAWLLLCSAKCNWHDQRARQQQDSWHGRDPPVYHATAVPLPHHLRAHHEWPLFGTGGTPGDQCNCTQH